MIVELVLATRNRHKGEELMALLGDLGIRIRTLADFPEAPEVEEDGLTCEANAIKKATEISRATGLTPPSPGFSNPWKMLKPPSWDCRR